MNSQVYPSVVDFYVNNTWTDQTCLFSFKVANCLGLDYAIFCCNITQSFVNDSAALVSGAQAWANFTHVLPSHACTVSFQFWVWDTVSLHSATTGLRYIRVNFYNNAPGTWNTPYISLIEAIQSVDSANNWTNTETYAQTLLAKKSPADLATMIDDYANAQDWLDVLKWSAFCNKLGFVQENDIINALGNYTMIGDLPFTDYDGSFLGDFCVESTWALYGYYYAATFNVSLTEWNITAAYQQFNSSVDYSIQHSNGLPLWIFADGTAKTFANRYYDEDACTIDCYLLFSELLNVSGAMDDALRWWSYTNSVHWNAADQHYGYVGTSNYECEAPFFLKIISTLKYYYPPLENWTRVLTDIENRFLSAEWNSKQWLDSASFTTYVVVHSYSDNDQRRLENTLAAWQTLLGVYSQLNSSYQSEVDDMLLGNSATEPAWALLIGPLAQLYNSSTGLFRWGSYPYQYDDNNATAYAEILLFLLGIVPQDTTIAFPLEELNYEYIQDIEPQEFQFNLTSQTVTIPVSNPGAMIFQYGASPITCIFNQSGIWQIAFSNSWNMVTNVTCLSGLLTNRIYYAELYPFNVTIDAYYASQNATDNVPVSMDGSPTAIMAPCTFSNLTGTHTFTVPNIDENGNTFGLWSSGETDPTLTVVSGGNYTAYYGTTYVLNITATGGGTTDPPPGLQFYGEGAINVSVTAQPSSGYALDYWELDGQNIGSSNPTVVTMNSSHDLYPVLIPIYSVVINAHCILEGSDVNLPILLDGSPKNYSTPYTFTDLNGTNTFTVPNVDADGHSFRQWNNGQTETTITTNSTGTYTAYYGTPLLHDIAVTEIAPSKSVVGQNYSLTVAVTVENLGDFPETFNLTLYANSTEIGNSNVTDMPNETSWQIAFLWNTTDWSYGNYTLSANASQVQGETDISDNTLLQGSAFVTIPGDVNGDFKVNLQDLVTLANAYSSHPGDTKWNPNADINSNGVVDLTDLVLLALHYGQHYP